MKRLSFYDVIIIGAGPAGIFAALELSYRKPNLSILLLEKGRRLDKRICPLESENTKCSDCSPCNKNTGWGGAGAFSDGKLTITDKVGGWLNEYLEPKKHRFLIKQADKIWLKFGAPTDLHKPPKKAYRLKRQAKKEGLDLLIFPIRHIGSDKTPFVLQNIFDFLKDRITIRTSSKVKDILVRKKMVWGIELVDGEEIKAKYVIVATGREGAGWFFDQASRLGLSKECNPVDLGVRIETKAAILKKLTDALHEAKFIYKTKKFGDWVRTFCMCPQGNVIIERTDGNPSIMTVNGQSKREQKTKNTNFALLVSTKFSAPFKDPVTYGKSVSRLSNLLGETVLIQRLGDLLVGRRSTTERIRQGKVIPTLRSATPGDLSFVLPYRHLTNIIEMLKVLDGFAPGLFSDSTLLYGVEVKFYSSRVKLKNSLETEIDNLFACGDGAGITRGLLPASVSGLVTAQSIIRKNN